MRTICSIHGWEPLPVLSRDLVLLGLVPRLLQATVALFGCHLSPNRRSNWGPQVILRGLHWRISGTEDVGSGQGPKDEVPQCGDTQGTLVLSGAFRVTCGNARGLPGLHLLMLAGPCGCWKPNPDWVHLSKCLNPLLSSGPSDIRKLSTSLSL